MRTVLIAVLGVVVCMLPTAHGRPPTETLQEDDCQAVNLGLNMRSNTGHSPVYILTSASSYSSNSRITVTIQAKDGETFNAFKVLAHRAKDGLKAGEDQYGTFTSFSKTAHLDCHKQVLSEAGAAGATTSVTFTWVPDPINKLPATDIKFWVAISKDNQEYWIPFESDVIHSLQNNPETVYFNGNSGFLTEKKELSDEQPQALVNEFRHPESCKDSECWVIINWETDEKYVNFNMTGPLSADQQYLAVGFSLDGTMSPAATVDCIRDSTDILIKSARNVNYGTGNKFLNPTTLGLGPEMGGQYVNGQLTCHFSYIRSKSTNNLDGDSDHLAELSSKEYHLIVAKGKVDQKSGALVQHTSRNFSPGKFNFTASESPPPVTTPKPKVEGEFRHPESCKDSECWVIINWETDEKYVNFNMTGPLSADQQYLAVGFSLDGTMSPAATVDCIRDSTDILIKSARNVNYGTGNKFLNPTTLGLGPEMGGQYVNGQLTCHFSYIRSKSTNNLDGDSDHLAELSSKEYHLIVAKGKVDQKSGALVQHTSRNFSPGKFNFTASESPPPVTTPKPKVVNEFRHPGDCKDSECWVIIKWEADKKYVNFNMTGPLSADQRYLAVGFSLDGNMFPAPTVDCMGSSTEVSIKSARNKDYATGNIFLDPVTLGLGPTMGGQYVDGRLACYFSYIISKVKANSSSDDDFLADLVMNEYYLIFAKGKVNQTGALEKHDMTAVSPMKLNFTASGPLPPVTTKRPSTTPPNSNIPQITTKECGIRKSCFREPENCESDACSYLVTWTPRGDYVDFELGLPVMSQDYVAVGFSPAGSKMGPAPVVVCRNNANGNFSILSTRNTATRDNILLNPPDIGLDPSNSKAGHLDGRIICRFSYVKSAAKAAFLYAGSDKDHIADFTGEKYNLIMAKGPLDERKTSGIGYHDANKQESTDLIDFSSSSFVNIGGTTENTLIKVHGCVLIVAWMISASIGVLMPRYFKPVWPNTKVAGKHIWFWIHQILMGLAFLLTVVGFIVIFVHVGGYVSLVGLPQTIHPVLGIIVTCLAIINPIMGLLRPDNNTKNRPLFNWAHRMVGQGAFMGAAANILIATFMAQSGMTEATRWVIVAYIGWHVFTEVILIGLTCSNSSGADKEDVQESKGARLPETVVLIVYCVGVIGLSVKVILRIAADI